jgi:hypothetical protein
MRSSGAPSSVNKPRRKLNRRRHESSTRWALLGLVVGFICCTTFLNSVRADESVESNVSTKDQQQNPSSEKVVDDEPASFVSVEKDDSPAPASNKRTELSVIVLSDSKSSAAGDESGNDGGAKSAAEELMESSFGKQQGQDATEDEEEKSDDVSAEDGDGDPSSRVRRSYYADPYRYPRSGRPALPYPPPPPSAYYSSESSVSLFTSVHAIDHRCVDKE